MSDTKHTPGPWAVIVHNGTLHVVTDTENPWPIADLRGPIVDGEWLPSDGLATARLIAAAPELLAALRGLVSYSVCGGADNSACHDGICSRSECYQCQRVDAARATIKKATGGA